MRSHSWNKLIAASFALAAAGILTCAAAFLDALMPRGSLVAFLANITLLGLMVTGVMIGYTWACDKCESRFWGRRNVTARPRETPARSAGYSLAGHGVPLGRHSPPSWNSTAARA